MYVANAEAARVLDLVTRGLYRGQGRCIDNAPGCFLPLYVECVGENQFSTAHYVQQHSDPVPDPEVTWWKSPRGTWVPLSIDMVTGLHIEAVRVDGNRPVAWNADALHDLVEFCNLWLGENFPDQQGGLAAVEAACTAQSVS